jgi:hypothetical protein
MVETPLRAQHKQDKRVVRVLGGLLQVAQQERRMEVREATDRQLQTRRLVEQVAVVAEQGVSGLRLKVGMVEMGVWVPVAVLVAALISVAQVVSGAQEATAFAG